MDPIALLIAFLVVLFFFRFAVPLLVIGAVLFFFGPWLLTIAVAILAVI